MWLWEVPRFRYDSWNYRQYTLSDNTHEVTSVFALCHPAGYHIPVPIFKLLSTRFVEIRRYPGGCQNVSLVIGLAYILGYTMYWICAPKLQVTLYLRFTFPSYFHEGSCLIQKFKVEFACTKSKCVMVPNFGVIGQSIIEISRFVEYAPSLIFKIQNFNGRQV